MWFMDAEPPWSSHEHIRCSWNCEECKASINYSSNIIAGFSCTGIAPFNRGIFDASDFAPSQVTDRPAEPADCPQPMASQRVPTPAPQEDSNQTLQPAVFPCLQFPYQMEYHPHPRMIHSLQLPPSVHPHLLLTGLSPEEVRPFPKAPPRKAAKGGARRRNSAISSFNWLASQGCTWCWG